MDYDENEGYEPEDNNLYPHDYEPEPSLYSESITVATELRDAYNRGQKKLLKMNQELDPGHFKFKRIVYKNNVKYRIQIEGFRTPSVYGAMIRDAVTGTRYPDYLVGSSSEDLFFSMKLATGEVKGESPVLFYSSPEECEKAQKCVLSDAVKNRWRKKNAIALSMLPSDDSDTGLVQIK
jgi:hypothetical protein